MPTDNTDFMATRHSERLAVVENEVKSVKEELHEHKIETRTQLAIVNSKLDDLLQLKYKGMGAFWLAASIIGSGIGGLIITLFTIFRGS